MDSGRGLLDLIIHQIPGISVSDKIRLCQQYDREEDLITEVPAGTMENLRLQAEKIDQAVRRRGLRYVSYAESGYPPLLREIYDPPLLLFYQGDLPDPEKPLAAVVGTRRPTGAAAAQAYDIGRDLGRAGTPVVSGLALGIDAMAHRGNLEGGGRTLAVLGSGPDMVYPSSNRTLARRILENGGALLSEYPPETGPMKWHFPARNRIISGLARAVLIVEAPESSGALITARFALEQGRDLWVASSGIASPLGEGTRSLERDGGRVINRAEEVLADWGIALTGKNSDSIPSYGPALAESLARSLNIRL
jgi:DNA processing protein